MHVVSKCLLAATVLTTNGALILVTMDITEVGIIFTLSEKVFATLLAVVMAVQDSPDPLLVCCSRCCAHMCPQMHLR